MTDCIEISDRKIGPGQPVMHIAEVGLAHDGSLGMAHSYIDAAALSGAAAIKFQTHLAEFESTAAERFRVRVFPQDATRYNYWARTAFQKSQWQELASHAREKGLLFLSSPFSEEAVRLLCDCQVPAWKVASGELENLPMLRLMCETGLPILLSSGMSSWEELDTAVQFVRDSGGQVALLQCTTAYPCPPDAWGLNVISEMRERFGCPVGLSDHSGSIVPGIAAVAMGADILEFHVAFSKQQFGPDVAASLTFDQVEQLVRGADQLRTALSHPVDKNLQAARSKELKVMFGRSVVSARSLRRGDVLKSEHLLFKKPAIGIPAKHADQLIGRALAVDVPPDHFFAESDFV